MSLGRVVDGLAERWGAILVGTAVSLHFLPIVYNAGLPPIDSDSALFQYMGWYMTEGGWPYVDIWDLKPPLIYYITAGIATLSRGNVLAIHLLSVLLTAATAVGSVLVVGTIVRRQTGNRKLALAAGLTLLTLPAFYQIPLGGARPKYFALLTGLLGIYLILEERPLLAGATTAIAAGFWHWAAIYPLLAVGIAILQSKDQALRVVASGIIVAVLVLVPFALRGTLDTLIAEVVLTIFLVGSESEFIGIRVLKIFVLYGYGAIIVPLGLFGAATAIVRRPRRNWWIAAGTGWFLVQILVFDFDWRADLLHLAAFLALGIAVLGSQQALWKGILNRVGRFVPTQFGDLVALSVGNRAVGPSIILVVAVLAVLSGPVWAGGMSLILDVVPLGPVEPWIPHKAPVVDMFRSLTRGSATIDPPTRYGLSSVQELYWSKGTPSVCHFRLSMTERKVIETLGISYDTMPCGDLDQYWRALVG